MISSDKWRYSLWSAFVFALVSHPYAYEMTSRITRDHTTIRFMIHIIVFTLIIRALMDVKQL
jgi:hypothetical protein